MFVCGLGLFLFLFCLFVVLVVVVVCLMCQLQSAQYPILIHRLIKCQSGQVCVTLILSLLNIYFSVICTWHLKSKELKYLSL